MMSARTMVFRALGARESRSYVAADQESEFVKMGLSNR